MDDLVYPIKTEPEVLLAEIDRLKEEIQILQDDNQAAYALFCCLVDTYHNGQVHFTMKTLQEMLVSDFEISRSDDITHRSVSFKVKTTPRQEKED